MTAHTLLLPAAHRDIDEIWKYTFKRWGFDQAERYIRQLFSDIEKLVIDPALGCPCSYVRAGYFKFRSGSHFVFFRIAVSAIEVVRILQTRMDYEQHL